MIASERSHIGIVKLLLEQKGIDVNAKNVWLFYMMFISTIWDFEIIFGIYFNYLIRHLYMQMKKVTRKSQNYLNKKNRSYDVYFALFYYNKIYILQ